MSGTLSPDLEEIAASAEVLSPDRFRIDGRTLAVNGSRPPFAPTRRGPAVESSSPAARMLGALADELYSSWYTRAGPGPGPGFASDPIELREHLGRLSSADGGRGAWEPGWTLRGFDGRGGAEVEKMGLVFRVAADRVRPAESRADAGSACRVRVPTEMRGEVAGSWCTRGETDLGAPGTAPCLVRIYWHLRPAAAAPLVRILTAGLDRRGIPFRLKVLNDPRDYRRADAGVLFLEPAEYRRAREVVRRAWLELREELRPEVPRLARRLAPGLGLSEGPGDGESFGGHRCGLIARGLVRAFESRASSEASRREAVRESFEAAGLDPRRPYLEAGSASRYGRFRSTGAPRAAMGGSPHRSPRSVSPLERAAEIGDDLCRSAFRAEGRCNWLGSAPAPGGGPRGSCVAALGADLYGGTCGVALFLAELHAVTGSAEHLGTAVGALRQAFAALGAEPGRLPPIGFYEGRLGIAWAARGIGLAIGSEELLAEATTLLGKTIAALPPERPRDVLSGDAGAILALLALHEETGEDRALEAAVRLGEDLHAALARDRGGHGITGLTGFSHGAAGVGLALLELSAATGAGELRDAADRTFEWEDDRFDPALRNWPDLRSPGPPGSMVAWCHGAPGIALARLRAIEIDPGRRDRYEPAARAGLATAFERIDRDLDRPGADACLCHGLAGLIEIAAYGATVLDDVDLGDRVRAAERSFVVSIGERTWPDPSLLTGAAGVGFAMLRASEPSRFPSMLLPGRLRRPPLDRKET